MPMIITEADTDAQIAACYPVMQALRPQVPEGGFLARLRPQHNRNTGIVWRSSGGFAPAATAWRLTATQATTEAQCGDVL